MPAIVTLNLPAGEIAGYTVVTPRGGTMETRTEIVTVKLTPTEKRRLTALAEREGRLIAPLLRWLAWRYESEIRGLQA